MALHRVRGRGAARGRTGHRGRVPRQISRRQAASRSTYERKRLARAPLVIAVVSRAGPHVKIPEWEQVLSAGAAAMSLVLAAHALGYGANWITEWYAYDRRGARCARPARTNEKIAGFIHIGTPKHAPEDRPRPPLAEIATRFEDGRNRAVGLGAPCSLQHSLSARNARCSTRPARTTTACLTIRSRRSWRRGRSAGSPR